MPRANLKIPGIDESQLFLNFEARFHKVGFVVLLCIIFLALFGFFSGGFVSDTVSKNTTGTMTLHSATGQHSGKNIYRIAGDFTTFYETENIWPQPDSMYSKGDALYLVYNTAENQQDSSIWIRVTPVKPGSAINVIQLNNTPEIRFRQFIYP